MADTIIQQAIATGSSPNKLTVSMWLKGMADPAQTTQRSFFGFRDNADTDRFFNFYMSSNQSLYTYWKDSSTVFTLGTTQKFIDPTAWGHFVLTMDTTLGTAADRVKMFWNGTRLTSFEDGLDSITQSKTMDLLENTDGKTTIGAAKTGSTWHYWDGCISHVHYTDGFAYEADTFGSFDSTSGIWKITTSPSVTYGTNGFFMLKNDASLSDDSGNGFTFTVESGSVQPVLDNPSNNFAVLNGLWDTGATMTNANTTAQSSTGNYVAGISSLGMETGKWYAEFKCITDSPTGESVIGLCKTPNFNINGQIVGQFGCTGLRNYNGMSYYDTGQTSGHSDTTSQHGGWSAGDTIGVAIDLDNNKVYFSKDGGWQDGTSTWGGSSPDTSLTLYPNTAHLYDTFFFECGDAGAGSAYSKWSANFGNGYFGTTAVTSGNADADGYGSFEYTVPTGYYALCTKNLASYGGH